MPQFLEGSVQLWQIVWMDLRPHLGEGLWRLAMPMNAPIPYVILETACVQVKTPGTKLGAIESQLKAIVALSELCFPSAPLCE
jgi:hypothetical protein